MPYPVDEVKLNRVRALLDAQGLDALVVRSPDNVVYLTNYWPMKGYAFAIFPRLWEPTLVVLEPQETEARRMAWTPDVRPFRFYDSSDPRPPTARALDKCLEVLRERGLTGRIAVELTQGSQGADRMAGEPTVYTKDYFSAFDEAAEVLDAVPLLTEARMIKTDQEIERMRLANELAALGLEHVRDRIEVGMKTSAVAAMFEGHVHEIGIGFEGKVDMARAFSLVWSGPEIRTFTPTRDFPVVANEPTLFEIWVCVDGYWNDLTKNMVVGKLTPRYERLLEAMLGVWHEAISFAKAGAELGELDRMIREGIVAAGYDEPSHPVSHGVGARAHEPPWPHQAGAGNMEAGMVLAIEPGTYFPEGGGLRLEDDFLITADGNEKLCRYPDDFR
ncbi:MAG: M24 family metallopeptidase [Acidimicrobiia bacterium]